MEKTALYHELTPVGINLYIAEYLVQWPAKLQHQNYTREREQLFRSESKDLVIKEYEQIIYRKTNEMREKIPIYFYRRR